MCCVAEKIIKTYGDLNGELHLVEFERSGNGLGLSLAGNKDLSMMSVFIVGIQQDSPVAHDGRIRVGDELLEVGLIVYFFPDFFMARLGLLLMYANSSGLLFLPTNVHIIITHLATFIFN